MKRKAHEDEKQKMIPKKDTTIKNPRTKVRGFLSLKMGLTRPKGRGMKPILSNQAKVNKYRLAKSILFFGLLLFAILYAIIFIKPTFKGITALATIEKETAYNQSLYIKANSSTEHVWLLDNPAELKSIRLSGSVSRKGNAKAYIENNNKTYLIFDSNALGTGLTGITGLAIDKEKDEKDKDDKKDKEQGSGPSKKNETELTNQTLQNTTQPIINQTNQTKQNITLPIINQTQNITQPNVTQPIINQTNQTQEINQTLQNITLPIINRTSNETEKNIPSNQTIQKSITLNLRYKQDSIFDTDNDGIESINGIVDFELDAKFNWEVEHSKLCTRWETYSIDNGTSATVCYGNEQCCNFVSLIPLRQKWNESFISAFGLYGAGSNNIISSQVLYVDYNLSLGGAYAEVYSSNWSNLSARFIVDTIEFSNVCIETCSLSGFNASSYKLILKIENATLSIDKISYTALEKIPNAKPLQSKNFSDARIQKNTNLTINLSKYFYDPDNDKLAYKAYHGENLSVIFEDAIARIIPDKGFTGTRFIYFIANDSIETAISNIFSLNISEGAIESTSQGNAIIGKAVKWRKSIKLDELSNNLSLKIPIQAFNISLKKIEDGAISEIADANVSVIINETVKTFTQYEIEKLIELIKKELQYATDEENARLIESLNYYNSLLNNLTQAYGITAEANTSTSQQGNATIVIQEPVSELELEYETPAARAFENDISPVSKQVIITSDVFYENLTAFTNIKGVPSQGIRLYWVVDEKDYKRYIGAENFTFGEIFRRVDITNNPRFNIAFIDRDNDTKIDSLQWLVPHTSNQTFEITLSILNVQSFPTVGGNWTVRFTTTGTANLTISATNGTSYSEAFDDSNITEDDLELLELRCDDVILFSKYSSINKNNTYLLSANDTFFRLNEAYNNSIGIKSVHTADYNCSGTGHTTVKVLTQGKHTQEFKFGIETAYANNLAAVLEPFAGIPINNTGAHINVIDEISRSKAVYPYTNNTLFAKYYNLTTDISTLYYDWYVDDSRVASFLNRSNLTSEFFFKGSYVWVSIILNNGSANLSSINSTDRIIIDTARSDFENGSLQRVNLTIQQGNVTLNYNGSGTNFTLSGNFTSQVFDLGITGNTTSLVWSEAYAYGDELAPIDGTVLLLHFNNNDTSDFSQFGNHGTQNSSVNCTGGNAQDNGKFFGACEFDGINDAVIVSNSSSLRARIITISAWLKGRSYSNENYTVIGMSDGSSDARIVYGLRVANSNPVFTLLVNNSAVNLSAGALTTDRWYFVSGVFNGSVAALYIDGLQRNSSNASSEINYTFQGDVFIGRKNDGNANITEPFNGTIDEIRILNKSLNSDEIWSDYLQGAQRLFFKTKTGAYYDAPNPRKVLALHLQKNALDYSGKSNHGTLLNATTFDEGILGAGALFNGFSAFINVSNSVSLRTEYITLEAWVAPRSSGFGNGMHNIIGMANGASNSVDVYSLKLADGKARFLLGSVNITGSVIANNTWHHIVGTFDGKYARLFVNGSVVNSTAVTGVISYANSGDVYIGKKNDLDNAEYFNGTIDEVHVYEYGMLSEEVKLLYESYLDWSDFGRDYVKDTDNSKVLAFDFSEMSGNLTIDESNYKNNGSVVGADWSHRGKHGSALSFDGIDNFVVVNDASSLDIISNFSITAWLKAGFSSQASIVEKQDAYRLYVNYTRLAAGFGYFGFNDTQGSTPLQNDTWHHVAVTHDNQNLRVYLDGSLDASYARNFSLPLNDNPLYIGGNSTARLFNGTIDSVAVYNRTLSPVEIKRQFLDRYENSSQLIGDSNRYIQYRAFLESDNANTTPALQDIIIRQRDYKTVLLNTVAQKTNLTIPLNNSANLSSIITFEFLEGQDIDFAYFNGSNYTKGYWSFEPEKINSTHVYDLSLYNNSGLIIRADCGNVSGKSGYACKFSGNGSYVEVTLK